MNVKIGLFFFRHRHLLYIPFVLAAFLVNWGKTDNFIVAWAVGFGLLIIGAALRLWAIRWCGKRTVYKRDEGKWLTMKGPYSHMRNPLYHSNILIGCGLIMFSRLVWLIPVFVIVGYIFYHFVVLFEESRLILQFGPVYRDFQEKVPRWIPRLTPYKPEGEVKVNPWLEIYLAERLRLLAVLLVLLLINLKEYLSR